MNTYFHPESENYKYWTFEDGENLKKLVNTGLSYKSIGKLLGRSGGSCQWYARELGLNNVVKSNKKYFVDEDFWETPNITNCYYAGFSAADASIQTPNGKSFTYKLEIQKSDEKFLKTFIKNINFTGPIKESIRPEKNSHTVRFTVSSIKWAEDLKKNFNIEPKKTHRLAPPNLIDKNLLLSWFIGYTDGDGSIHLGGLNKQFITIAYVSSSEKIIHWLKSFIDEVFTIKMRNRECNIRKNPKWNCWHYTIGGIKAAIIIDTLKNFHVPKLDRKWHNPAVLTIIDKYKQEYPEYFQNNLPIPSVTTNIRYENKEKTNPN